MYKKEKSEMENKQKNKKKKQDKNNIIFLQTDLRAQRKI